MAIGRSHIHDDDIVLDDACQHDMLSHIYINFVNDRLIPHPHRKFNNSSLCMVVVHVILFVVISIVKIPTDLLQLCIVHGMDMFM